jgi:hypothetical protein
VKIKNFYVVMIYDRNQFRRVYTRAFKTMGEAEVYHDKAVARYRLIHKKTGHRYTIFLREQSHSPVLRKSWSFRNRRFVHIPGESH